MKEVNYSDYVPIIVEHYPRYDLENVFDLDDLQLGFLIRGLDPTFRLERANTLPGMIDSDGMKATINAAPKPRVDSSSTFEWLQQQCIDKGLTPPER